MIINLRGGYGSGKTTVVRQLIDTLPRDIRAGPKNRPEAYLVGSRWPPLWHVAVLGDYSPRLVSATGADSITHIVDLEALVRRYARQHHVLIEGAHISGMYGRWLRLSREAGPGQYVWLFLDTPYEICWERLQQRNNRKPIKQYIFDDWYARNQNYRERLSVEGELVEVLRWESAFEDLKGLLDSYLQAPPALEHLSLEPFVGKYSELPKLGRGVVSELDKMIKRAERDPASAADAASDMPMF